MGYWSQDEDGNSFAGDGSMVWGDAPADIVGDALADIVAVFTADVGRPPTDAELRAGWEFSVRARED